MNHNKQFQHPQIFNTHYVRTDFKQQPLVINLSQSRSKALSVDRVKLKQSNDNVEQLIDLWQRHKSITQQTPTNISNSFLYHSTAPKNESFIIEEIPETREVSPLKEEILKPKQLFESNTNKMINSNHKKTSSQYIGALSKSDAFSSTKKLAKENMKINAGSNSKKPSITSSQKKISKEVQSIIQQLQIVQKSIGTYYSKLEKKQKHDIEEQFNQLISQIKVDLSK